MLTSAESTPPVFAAALRQLFDFLSLVAEHAEINKMTASNLAVCFTPTLSYLPLTHMESADRILKKLANCIAQAILAPADWLPLRQDQMAPEVYSSSNISKKSSNNNTKSNSLDVRDTNTKSDHNTVITQAASASSPAPATAAAVCNSIMMFPSKVSKDLLYIIIGCGDLLLSLSSI